MPFLGRKFVFSLAAFSFFTVFFSRGWTPLFGFPSNSSHAVSPGSFLRFPVKIKSIKDGRFVDRTAEGYQLTYTLQPELQQWVEKVFEKYRVPYGAFVAMEPKTGKILAMTSYSSTNQIDPQQFCLRATFPAASLFKLVTAAAALELGQLTPESQIGYRGNMYQLTPAKLSGGLERGHYLASLAEALARSNNVAFAKLAVDVVGAHNLEAYARAFGFNRPLLKELPLEISHASIPQNTYELGRCGAGFGEVSLSPLHASMLAASIANGGEMIAPYLVEEIQDAQGKMIYQAYSLSVSRPINARTAEALTQMMQETIRIGTSRRAFTGARGKPYFPEMDISGKTGTLRGSNPPGHYTWFVGFAPSKDPQIALSALVINQDPGRIRIKGSDLARIALQGFFPEGEETPDLDQNGNHGPATKAQSFSGNQSTSSKRSHRRHTKNSSSKKASHTKKKH